MEGTHHVGYGVEIDTSRKENAAADNNNNMY